MAWQWAVREEGVVADKGEAAESEEGAAVDT